MSALVGYESSSDESESTAPSRQVEKQIRVAKEDEVLASTHEQKEQNVPLPIDDKLPPQGPTLGPSRPEPEMAHNGFEEGPENGTGPDTESAPSSPYTAQRSALRVLTAASFMSSSIPASPPGSPNPAANDKFARFLELKSKGVHFNEDLARKSSFQNPSLLPNMLARAGLTEEDQYVSTLPKGMWHVEMFPEWAYKEGLLQQQREVNQQLETERKAQSASGKRNIDFVSEVKTSTSSAQGHGNRQSIGTPSKRKRP